MDKGKYKTIYSNIDIRDKAIEQALDIRKFEIDMYWKRATYFWTFIAAALAGYFLLLSKNTTEIEARNVILFFINSLGFIFSLSWFFVNKGSKFWQENWEMHVDLLENTYMGPLYKTVVSTSSKSILGASKYSVSRINIALSLFVTVMWGLLGLNTLFSVFISKELLNAILNYFTYERLAVSIQLVSVIFFIVLITWKGKTSEKTHQPHFLLRDSTYEEVIGDIENAEKEN